jgi:GTPase SAR1 family protein
MKYREEERLLAIADTEAVASYAEHTRSLIRVAAGLSAVTQIAERVGAQAASEAARQALQKLESGTFLIAVVGEFKRGKSTFINALLGDNVLPADVLPTTAVVNRIVYGRHPACILRLNDGSSRTIAVAELRNYVTKLTPDSATAAESLTEAIVAMPTMFGQNNIQIVDTPGLGDEASMTARTMAVLPSADAAILILSARSPFSDSEMQLLRTLLNLVPADRVFIVVNQIDLLAKGADIDRVLAHVDDRAQAIAGDGNEARMHVVALSAQQALEAKMQRDHGEVIRSRFAAFERVLEDYLARNRGFAVLQRADQALHSASDALLGALRAKRSATERTRQGAIEELQSRIGGLAALRERVRTMLDELAPRVEDLTRSLDGIGKDLAQHMRQRAADVGAATMDANWAEETHAAREMMLNRTVHAAMLPELIACADAVSHVALVWAQEQLNELVGAERILVELCLEAADKGRTDRAASPVVRETVSDLAHAILPDLLSSRREIRPDKLQELPDVPRRLSAPPSLDAIGGIATEIEWIKAPGETCMIGEQVARLANQGKEMWVVTPLACRLASIAPNARSGTGRAIGADAALGSVEPIQTVPSNSATGAAICSLRNCFLRFHLDWQPERPVVEQSTTRRLTASALGTAGWMLRGTNESLKGFDRLRRTLDAGTSYVDRQLRAVMLANVDAALQDEMLRLSLQDLPRQVRAETAAAVTSTLTQRYPWISAQATQRMDELRLRLQREMVLLERDSDQAEDLEAQVIRIGKGACRGEIAAAMAPELSREVTA